MFSRRDFIAKRMDCFLDGQCDLAQNTTARLVHNDWPLVGRAFIIVRKKKEIRKEFVRRIGFIGFFSPHRCHVVRISPTDCI